MYFQIPSDEEEEIGFMRRHLDAISFWIEEVEKMSQIRLLPFNKEPDVQENLGEQVVEVLEELMESGVLDARTGWLGKSHY